MLKRCFKVLEHTLKSKASPDSRLKPCKFCGSEMLGRFNNTYTTTFIFSCSNPKCILHRTYNNISIDPFRNLNHRTLTEDEVISVVNGEENYIK